MSESSLAIAAVTDENYPAFLNADAAVVAFGMIACAACEALDPVLQQASQMYGGKVSFGKVKMHVPGVCREIKKRFSFETFPTTHFYKRGVLAHTVEGKMDIAVLSAHIQTHLLGPVEVPPIS